MVLEVRDLNARHRIRDVSFTLRKGEILGFAGLMGAGRTEVARAIFGADPIDAGEIRRARPRLYDPLAAGCGGARHRLSVRRPQALRPGDRSRRRDQHRAGQPCDVSSRLAFSCDQPRDRCDRAPLRAASGDQDAVASQQQVRLLSGGNQQKIVIAKWLLRDCDILFFDEPTRGIDVGAKSEIYKLLHALAAQGKAIVMIFVRAARDPAHEPPHPRDVRGSSHRRTSATGGHAGENHATGHPAREPRHRLSRRENHRRSDAERHGTQHLSLGCEYDRGRRMVYSA